MEKTEKNIVYLKDCAKIAEIIENNSNIKKTVVTMDIEKEKFVELLKEIEEFVKTRVNRNQSTISLTIGKTEFIFNRD